MKELSTYSIKEIKEKINYLNDITFKMSMDLKELKKEFIIMKKARDETFNACLNSVIDDIRLCYGIDIHAQHRGVPVIAYRGCLIHILLEKCEISLAETGKLLGGKEHSTVIHAKNKVTDLLSIKDEYYTDVYDKVEEIFDKYFEI